MTRPRIALLALCFVLAFCLTPSCAKEAVIPATAATYVGRQACVACHQREHGAWHGSHHDLAMQEATSATVLGDFDNASYDHFGTVTKFYKDGGRFMVRTDGPDGALTDYEVKYVFGVYPLQQLLIPFPKGRMQALGIAWDSRSRAEGGQRWFHLYQEKIAHDDILHWSGRAQNWNHMCAHCHSTNLRKNYDATSDSFATSWSEIDVSCEACHGPASHHLAWAGDQSLGYANRGFSTPIKNDATWVFEDGKTTAVRRGGEHARLQTERCARCHALRMTIDEDHAPQGVHDSELVQWFGPQTYHADGQIKDEVYVYGSFVQSKMHHAGVTCTDCHDPHTTKTRAQGNALCLRCHDARSFDSPRHHHHTPGTKAAQCVTCHMPAKTYMVVDPRLDHSIRIPRPDLSAQLGTPNACSSCHDDKSAQWAADAITRWKPGYQPRPHYGSLLHVADPDAPADARLGARLAAMSLDPQVPAIARATGLARLAQHLDADSLAAVRQNARDPDPMLRRAALAALVGATPADRIAIGGPLLKDPRRSVRIEAVQAMAGLVQPPPATDGVASPALPAALRPDFDAALVEYEQAHRLHGDQPANHVNLGNVYTQLGRLPAAEAEYRHALRLDDRWETAYVYLADVLRQLGRHADSEQTLREGLNRLPTAAGLNHEFGLALHRSGKTEAALKWLGHAARLAPDTARYPYVYGVALESTGKFHLAMDVLAKNHARHPRDFDTLYALATYHAKARKLPEARRWAERLSRLAPGHPGVRQLLQQLQSGR